MLTRGQRIGLDQLGRIENESKGTVQVVSIEDPTEERRFIRAVVSIHCENFEKAPGGLPLERRERFIIHIPPDFPIERPDVWTPHSRFAGFAHVQWTNSLCLYQAPATEWFPNDGMFGFFDRLYFWLTKGALNQLDPPGLPLHPPVAYPTSKVVRTVIPKTTPPSFTAAGWIGAANLEVKGELRVDITGWSRFQDAKPPFGAAILLSRPLPFEYPVTVSKLISELAAHGLPKEEFLDVLKWAALKNPKDTPLYVILGTPMRGLAGTAIRHQHLAVWFIDSTSAWALKATLLKDCEDPEIAAIAQKLEKLILEWANKAPLDWCHVREDRPEIVVRRDNQSPAAWFNNRCISIWGCGALGSFVAEFVTRAGARKLILRDNATVAPGLLARQLYSDDDIGQPKVEALKRHLLAINPKLEVDAKFIGILSDPLSTPDWTDGSELLVDTTASRAIHTKFELIRRTTKPRVPVAFMMVNHDATSAFFGLAPADHAGAILDVTRRAKLEACARSDCSDYADDFWPSRPRSVVFQPEPGCSDPTFVGSAADIATLAGLMTNALAREIPALKNSATACFLRQPLINNDGNKNPPHVRFAWRQDYTSIDVLSGFEVRIAPPALREMLAWARRRRRTEGPTVETGGHLFGERDEVTQTIWIDEVSGPPPDSRASSAGFECGIEGIQDACNEKEQRTRGSVRWIGMWHTHPQAAPLPSHIDVTSMEQYSFASKSRPLLTIIGGTPERPSYACYLHGEVSRAENRIPGDLITFEADQVRVKKDIGLALSGGGSRAIAFHLGCLRALHDLGLLPRIQAISAVSGGSVIAAVYAYLGGPFSEFEKRIKKLLSEGLAKAIGRKALLSPILGGSLATAAISGTAAVGADLARMMLQIVGRASGAVSKSTIRRLNRLQPPLRRWASRTTAFRAALRDALFGDRKLTDARTDDVHVVLNACELRTGSAFRFGSKETGCWRYGRLKSNTVDVATAVATSAAYPVLLPALDEQFTFITRDERELTERVLLTDGGIYDNLGLTCLEPDSSPDFGYNVFHPDYLICCDAGAGLFSDETHPYWWPTRMIRSFEAVFRKAHDAAIKRLHSHDASGKVKGFVLAYLGQQDDRLPVCPPDLVRRKEIFDYPTDFSPMKESDVMLLSNRGEMITRLLIARYCPGL